MFDEYVNIHEQDLATKAGIEKEQAIKFLQQLDKAEVLSYLPQTDQPRITFNRARVDASEIKISPANLLERKKRFIQKADALLHYATDSNHCRSMMLLQYFGENAEQRCGTCDYCRERNKLEVNDFEFESISQSIKEALSKKPLDVITLMEHLPTRNEDKVLKVIQWLLDNGDLHNTTDEKLMRSK